MDSENKAESYWRPVHPRGLFEVSLLDKQQTRTVESSAPMADHGLTNGIICLPWGGVSVGPVRRPIGGGYPCDSAEQPKVQYQEALSSEAPMMQN